MTTYLDELRPLIAEYSYLAIFFALLLENTIFLGVFVPGVTVLLLAGFAGALGELNLGGCVLAGYLGTIAGDNLCFVLGRYGADRFRLVRDFIDRNSGIVARIASLNTYALIFFHFPGVLRIAAPIALGATKLGWRKWLGVDLSGALIFNIGFIGLGFVVGRSSGLYANAETVATYLQYLFSLFFVVWLVILFSGSMRLRGKRIATIRN